MREFTNVHISPLVTKEPVRNQIRNIGVCVCIYIYIYALFNYLLKTYCMPVEDGIY